MLEEQNSFEQRDIVKLSQNSLREPKSNNLKIKFQDIILEKQPSQDSAENINNSQSSKGHEQRGIRKMTLQKILIDAQEAV